MPVKKRIGAAVLGIVVLLLGVFLQFQPGVSADERLRCEQIVRERYGSGGQADLDMLLGKCEEPGMVAMMIATSERSGAQAAAGRIASANRSGVFGNMLSLFLIGFGAGVVLITVLPSLIKRKKE